jgi:DNA primase
MNIFDLITMDGGTLRKVAGTHGGEWSGACPFCGGSDRFRVWPGNNRFWCRSCEKSGDAIQYLRDFRKVSYIEACKVLCINPKRSGITPSPSTWEPREAITPPLLWQEKADSFFDRSVSCLWSDRGDPIRQWLHDAKGLTDDSIRAAGLGFNPSDFYAPRAAWGLDSTYREDGSEKVQWLPSGLVIPLLVDGGIHRIRIRRMEEDIDPKYVIVSGSSSAPMIFHPDRAAVVIVESELDAILLNQECGDLVTSIAMGSACMKPDKATHNLLMAAEIILVSLDNDEAGARAAWAFWSATYGGKVKRWPTIRGKDPSAAWLNGLDLRAWVIAGRFGTEEQFERFCINTE